MDSGAIDAAVAGANSFQRRSTGIGQLRNEDILQGGGRDGTVVSPSYPESNSMRLDASVPANLMARGFGSQDS